MVKRKRQNKKAGSSSKRYPSNGSTNDAATKKIIGLNDDCLEKIFGYLDLKSLFAVAISNEYLRPAANLVYKRKCKDIVVNIRGAGNDHVDCQLWICYEKISITDLKTCLQFLRCFGSSLTNVHIYYEFINTQRYVHVHHYINKYCAENLKEIEFAFKPRLSIDNFAKPFINVEKVAVYYGCLSDQFPLFSKWFPNLRSLKIQNSRMEDGWIDSPLYRLEHLSIDVNSIGRVGFTKTEAAHLLDSCDHLKSLTIQMSTSRQGMTLNTLLNMINGKPMIESLCLSTSRHFAVKFIELQRLVNEHPSLIELSFTEHKFTAENALFLIRQLISLNNFQFGIDGRLDFTLIVSQSGNQWQQYSRYFLYQNHHYAIMKREN